MVFRNQSELFDARALPEGFLYQAEAIRPADEQRLIEQICDLPFQAFQFHGFEGRRRVVSYGQRYDFNQQRLEEANPIPAFLDPVLQTAAGFAELPSADLQQVSVIEYSPGSAIGWHRDKAEFGDVIGLSLLSPCRFRFRRKQAERWERASFTARPRSLYLLRGPARTDWEHSIPPVNELRYSITMRTLR